VRRIQTHVPVIYAVHHMILTSSQIITDRIHWKYTVAYVKSIT